MAKKESKNDDSKLFAFLAILLSIVGFIIAIVAKKDNKYVMFYARQSLVLFIMAVIVKVADIALIWIPILGWLIIIVLNALLIGLWIVGLIYSLSGEMKNVPIVGDYAKRIDI